MMDFDTRRRAGLARRRLAKQGVLWLTRRIGQHALRGEWQHAREAAASRDRLLASVPAADLDPGIAALRTAAREAAQLLSAPLGRSPRA